MRQSRYHPCHLGRVGANCSYWHLSLASSSWPVWMISSSWMRTHRPFARHSLQTRSHRRCRRELYGLILQQLPQGRSECRSRLQWGKKMRRRAWLSWLHPRSCSSERWQSHAKSLRGRGGDSLILLGGAKSKSVGGVIVFSFSRKRRVDFLIGGVVCQPRNVLFGHAKRSHGCNHFLNLPSVLPFLLRSVSLVLSLPLQCVRL